MACPIWGAVCNPRSAVDFAPVLSLMRTFGFLSTSDFEIESQSALYITVIGNSGDQSLMMILLTKSTVTTGNSFSFSAGDVPSLIQKEK